MGGKYSKHPNIDRAGFKSFTVNNCKEFKYTFVKQLSLLKRNYDFMKFNN